jgi:16S rRNA processing protein RimM
MTAPDKPSPWVWLAHIRRPQGRKGEVFADILTDFPEKFAERRRLWLVREDTPGAPGLDSETGEAKSRTLQFPITPPVEVRLSNHWLHKGGVVLHFEGVDSISAAELLKGLYAAIPRAERALLADGEAYISDLVGCILVDVASAEPHEAGTIEDVDRSAGPVPLLVVSSPHGEILIPFAKDYLRRIDLEGRRVEMALPEGLVDLNTPEK